MPVASSLQKMLGAPALLLPMGQVCACLLLTRSMQWCKQCVLPASLPWLLIGMCAGSSHLQPAAKPLPTQQASDCPHLANERIRRLNLVRGKNVVKNLLVEVGQAAACAGNNGKQAGGLANGGPANGAGK